MSGESYIYSLDTIISPHTNRPFTDGEVSNEKEQVKLWCEVCQRLIIGAVSSIQHVYGKTHRLKVNAKYGIIPKDDDKNVPDGKAEAKELGADNLAVKKKRSRTRKRGQGLNETNPSVSADKEPAVKKAKDSQSQLATSIDSKADPPKKKNKQEDGTKEDQKKTKAEDNLNLKCDDCDIVFKVTLDALNHFKGKKHIKKITSLALAKEESHRLKTRGAAVQRGAQSGRSRNRPPPTRGHGLRGGINPIGSGLRGGINPIGSLFQADLYDRIGKFLATRDMRSVPYDYGSSYGGINNSPAVPNRYSSSMRVGGLNNTFRTRGTFDGTGQQRESYQNNSIESRPAQQNDNTEPNDNQSLHNNQMGSSNNGYYSHEYREKNKMAASDPYGSFY